MNNYNPSAGRKSNIKACLLLVLGLLLAFLGLNVGIFMFLLYAIAAALIAFAALNAADARRRVVFIVAGAALLCCLIPAAVFAGNGIILSITLTVPAVTVVFLYIGDKKRLGRTQVILMIAAFLAFVIIAVVISVIYVMYSSVGREALKDIHSKLTDPAWVIEYYTNALPGVDASQISEVLTEEYLSDLFNTTVWFAPTLIAFISLLFAWIATAIYRFLALAHQDETTPDYAAWSVTMSGVSAVVFLVAFLLSFLSSYSDVGVFYVATANIMYMLLPGFIYLGIRNSSQFLLFFCVMLLFLAPAYAFVLIALSGAFKALSAGRKGMRR